MRMPAVTKVASANAIKANSLWRPKDTKTTTVTRAATAGGKSDLRMLVRLALRHGISGPTPIRKTNPSINGPFTWS